MLRLTTLGALDLRDRLGHPIRDVLAQPKRLALLIYLVLEGRGGPVSRDRLLALFWPESDDAKARNTLSQALHHLRQAIGPDLIESQGANTLLIHGDALWCDAVVFADALERGETELALDLYRGEFCPTLFASGAPEAEQWLGTQRQALRRRALAAARQAAEQKAATGDAGAARAARRALAMQPDDEADVRSMMALLDRQGDAAGALNAYLEFARRMAAELELEPSPETTQLADGIRRRREQAALAPGPAGTADGPGAPAAMSTAVPSTRAEHWLRRHALLAAVAFAAVVIVGAITLRPGAAAPASTFARHTVAVLPFSVRGGASLGYLGEGMVDMLSAKLDGVSGFHAADPRSVVAAVAAQAAAGAPSAQTAALTARRLGAGWYISGDVVEMAGRLQIRGSLYQAQDPNHPAAVASVTGDTTALFALVDDLTGRLLVGFGSGRDTSLTRLASVTTHSLPALKAFLTGEQAMRSGRDALAAEAFREAAMLDTTFAVAQYRLAMSATWVSVSGANDNPTIASMAAAAARHARNLTPLLRDLLSAYTTYKLARSNEAESAYRRITESHPDNVEAWFMLGETWFHLNPYRGRSPQQARQAFERVLLLDPGNTHAILHLARLAALDGRDGDLDSLGRMYLGRYRDAERTLEMRTLLASLRHDPEERRVIARAAVGADLVVMTSLIQAAMAYTQDLDLTRALAASFMRMRLPRDSLLTQAVMIMVGDVELGAGRSSRRPVVDLLGSSLDDDWLLETRALLAACRAVPVSRARLAALRDSIAARRPYRGQPRPNSGATGQGETMQAYLLGLLSARLGDTAQVRTQLRTLEAVRSSDRLEAARGFVHSLRAELAWLAGDPASARAELDQFTFGLPYDVGHWGMHERFLMAELLRALGRDEDALEWYLSFPAGWDQLWVAPAHLRAAQIYQRQRNRERATFHYTRFIRLWRDADPEFQPMVAQAREALARLSQ